jgi:signal peptidase II
MNRRRLQWFAVILAACVGCDHASKQAAVSLLADSAGLELVGGMLRFQLAFNPGGFLSVGAGLSEGVRSVFFLALVPLLIAFVCLHFARSERISRSQLAALAVLSGGGFGNWLDRVLHDGVVTDFVSVGFGPLRTGIFNLADLAVIAGILWLLRSTRRPEAPLPEAAD